jgi:hypothetical protein
VDPRTGLDDVEKRKFLTLSRLELRPLGHPARSQSLYRLRYPGSVLFVYLVKITHTDLSTEHGRKINHEKITLGFVSAIFPLCR